MKGLLIKEFIMFRKNCIAPIIFLIFIMFCRNNGTISDDRVCSGFYINNSIKLYDL